MTKNYLIKFVLLSMILTTISCKKPSQEPVTNHEENEINLTASKSEVVAAGENFVIAINSGDHEAAADCYTEDAKIMRPNSQSIVGKANILKAFAQRLNQGKLRFSMKTIAVYGEGDMLTAEEEWMLSDDQGKIIDEGKSLEIYKKEGGKWKMFRDCFNSNIPCQGN